MTNWTPYLFTRARDLKRDAGYRVIGGGSAAYLKAPPYLDSIPAIGGAAEILCNSMGQSSQEKLDFSKERSAPKALLIGDDHVFVGEFGSLSGRLGREARYAYDQHGREISYVFGLVGDKTAEIPSIDYLQSIDASFRSELDRLIQDLNEGRVLSTNIADRIVNMTDVNSTLNESRWNTASQQPAAQRRRGLFFALGDLPKELVDRIVDQANHNLGASDLNVPRDPVKKKILPPEIHTQPGLNPLEPGLHEMRPEISNLVQKTSSSFPSQSAKKFSAPSGATLTKWVVVAAVVVSGTWATYELLRRQYGSFLQEKSNSQNIR